MFAWQVLCSVPGMERSSILHFGKVLQPSGEDKQAREKILKRDDFIPVLRSLLP